MPNSRRGSVIIAAPVATDIVTVNDDVVRRVSVANPDFAGLQADSKDATKAEVEMSLRDAVKLYRKAIGWSVLLSTAIVMEGYDIVLLANFFALPSFSSTYGNQTLQDGTKTVSAPWRSALTSGALIGEIIGLFFTGIAQDRYGYKKTIGAALVAMIAFIFVVFFAVSLPMLLVGEVLCGLCWGAFQTLTTAYASEVTPTALRAYLTTYVNLCWVLGQLIASGLLRSVVDRTTHLGYKIPFALQWMWPVPILIGCILCPESPWWLVRQGRFDDAKASLLRLTSKDSGIRFDADQAIAMMEHTTQLERGISSGFSYLDCFRKTDLRRTEITCATWFIQTICGTTFMGYSTVFYEAAGLPTTQAFNLSMIQYALGACGTFTSWFIMSACGRRKIYLYGCMVLCALLFIIGFCGIDRHDTSAQWAIGSMLIVFAFIYNCTLGPVAYSIISEIPSTRLKAKTLVIARLVYNIASIVVNIITNYQLTSTAWNWGAFSGFFWGFCCALSVVWIYWRLPEPKGRTYGQLDILFEQKVPARKFAAANVDIFRGETVLVTPEDVRCHSEREKACLVSVDSISST